MAQDTQSVARSIQALRQRYAVELTEHEKRLSAIRAKVQVLDELLAEQVNGQAIIPATSKTDVVPEGITEATMWVVNKHGKGAGLGKGAVREHMLASGYKPNGKNFDGTLHTTLKRLVQSERILGEKTNGVWTYRAKP